MMEDIYINTIKDQISSGMYAPLFENRSGLVFLDIGANVGLVSIYAVPFCKRIVAVEPCPWTYSTLRQNVRNCPIIECLEAALSPRDDVVPFFVNDINPTASSTVNTYGKEMSVHGVKLDSMLEMLHLTHVDVCKVDAEGAEGESLDYYQIDHAKDIIDEWWIEFHNCPKTTWEHKLGTAIGNFCRVGYGHMTVSGMALHVRR